MRILYLHQYFNTPSEGGSLRSYYIAKAMVAAGHEVVMLTTHSQPTTEKRHIEGIEVHYLPIPYQNAFGFWERIRAFFHFAQASYKLSLTLPAPNLIYATSTPLTVGLSAMWISKKLKIPYIFEVRDLWPLVPISLGILRNPVAQWLSKRLEKQIYQKAHKIVALSPAMQSHIQSIAPKKEVVMVSNMAIPQATFTPTDTLKVAYFGTVGYANHLEYLVEIARYCHEYAPQDKPLEFWVVGKGARYEAVKQLAEAYNLPNIRFFAHKNAFEVGEMMRQVQAIYVSFLDNPALASTSPNKFFEGLAAGKLCIVNVQGWLRELVEEHHCGFYANPHEPSDFLTKILPLLSDTALLLAYQRQAGKVAEECFSVSIQTQKIVDLLRF